MKTMEKIAVQKSHTKSKQINFNTPTFLKNLLANFENSYLQIGVFTQALFQKNIVQNLVPLQNWASVYLIKKIVGLLYRVVRLYSGIRFCEQI